MASTNDDGIDGDYVKGPEMTPENAPDFAITFGRQCSLMISEVLAHDHRKGPHPQGMYRELKSSPVITDPRTTPMRLELVAIAIPVQALKAMAQCAELMAEDREMERRGERDVH